MIESNLERLEELTLKMNAEDIGVSYDENFDIPADPVECVCDELSYFFRDIPKFVVESLEKGEGFSSTYDKVLPQGDVSVCLEGNTVWDCDNKKCLLDIEITMTSSEEN